MEKSLARAALWDEVKDRLHESALGLSGGQHQRLCIARAIAVDPEIILMDEPCSALDPRSTTRIEDLIGELRGDYTIIIVTHNMQQAARVSDYTAFLYEGVLIEFGPPRVCSPSRDRSRPKTTSRADSADTDRRECPVHLTRARKSTSSRARRPAGPQPAVVEQQVHQAVKAVEGRDPDLAEEVVRGDVEIDQAEVEVEEECLKMLALHQPVAVDLASSWPCSRSTTTWSGSATWR